MLRAILISIVTLTFLYINYVTYISCDINDKNTTFLNLEAALLSLIVGIIGLYIAINNRNKQINLAEIENI